MEAIPRVRQRLASGADSRFFRSLQQLLLSLERHGHKQYEVLIYDLGLEPRQREHLRRRFDWVELRPYEHPAASPHLSDVSNYGWKPTIIAWLGTEKDTPVLWLDSACVVTGSLDPVWRQVSRTGVWSPYGGSGAVQDWSLPAVLKKLQASSTEEKLRMRAAGVCAYDPAHRAAMDLVQKWAGLASDEELLCPPGCKTRHKYDQTLWTVSLHRSGLDPGSDELDISSTRPISFLRTRNKVPNWVPLWVDGLVRLYFWLYRCIDVQILKARAQP